MTFRFKGEIKLIYTIPIILESMTRYKGNISVLINKFTCYTKFCFEYLFYVSYDPPEPNTKNKDIIICLEKSPCLHLQGTPE